MVNFVVLNRIALPLLRTTFLVLFATAISFMHAQTTQPLYPGSIPNSRNASNEEVTEVRDNGTKIVTGISVPTLSIYIPKKVKANGTAVIIFPGGGYRANAISHEGTDVAAQFNEWGITAFVVKYRLPDQRTMQDPSIGPLQDAQQAILEVRRHAKDWGVDPGKVGIMGFSAGGHLASTLGTHYNTILVDNPGKLSVRPDFMILLYPVISSDSTFFHRGSFENLLGKNASPAQRLLYSNEKQVTADTPPTFLVHASDDKGVPVKNSIVFYEALLLNNVPAEMHIYQGGGHGFGLNNPTTTDKWMDRCANWLRSRKLL